MLETTISVGDIVHLNSGSPDLKVIGINGDEVEVQWDGETGTKTDTFRRICLTQGREL